MYSTPASSAVRATVASSAQSRSGPRGVLKSGICKPIFIVNYLPPPPPPPPRAPLAPPPPPPPASPPPAPPASPTDLTGSPLADFSHQRVQFGSPAAPNDPRSR